MQMAGEPARLARLFDSHSCPRAAAIGLLAASDATKQAPAANCLGSRPIDVLSRGVGVLPREAKGCPPYLPGLGETRRSTQQYRDSRRDSGIRASSRRR